MKSPWRLWFRREKKKAVRLVSSPVAVLRAADEAAEKARRARGPLGRIWSDLQAAVRLTRAWARRDYRDVSRGTIVLVVAGLLYLISPIDAIIDAIPVLGYLDDAAVLAWVLGQVRAELDLFREWEDKRRLTAGANQPA
jgi:uncharacterized membrane protein YkvA (DUF1232 family)